MSYILEALRKSQQEREQGNVPTLETDAYVEPVESSINPWIAAAVVLAALAVAIALYAALEARTTVSELVQAAPSEENVPESTQDRGGRIQLEDQQNLSVTNRRLAPAARDGDARQAMNGDLGPTLAPSPPLSRSLSVPPELPDEAPLVEPPPPKQTPVPRPVARVAPRPAPVTRGLDVPEDVVRDIETFKEELRFEQSVESGRPVPKKPEPKDPRDLRLPKEVAVRQPAFVMTVHVHEKEAAKRFVVINARKYRQGDTTREGLIVDDIMPDGAILSFEGHRFYSRR